MAKQWYAVAVKPHKEHAVLQQIRSRDIEGFLPLMRVIPKNPRSAKLRPYFPGYMFVHADLDVVGRNQLNHLPGTRGLVSFAGEPAVVPERMITLIQDQLEKIEKAGGFRRSNINKGDTVKIVSGPFAGYEAIFDKHLDGKERVRVLLEFLSNYPQRVEIDIVDIKKK